ncbi:IS3 family transposase [Arthrobacter sp. SA17]
MKAVVTQIFKKNHGRYGHCWIHIELLKQGWTVAKKTVLKLMRSLPVVCTEYGSFLIGRPSPPRLVAQSGAGQRLAAGCLGHARDGLKPRMHSDQGFQYQHDSWRTLCEPRQPNRYHARANCYDNAVMENLVKS